MKEMRLFLLASTALVPLSALPALANPLGGEVVAGSASIEGAGTGAVTVNQSTDKAIINWNTFDIGNGEITTFVQPSASSVVLNRVTGGLGPSEIIGSLVANGQVYLVNRDGILFGKDAVIDTGALLATTHDILNEDFLDGDYRFDIPGSPSASVVNLGVITVDDGGYAALVAPGVRNDGIITARLGKVGLASGNGFSLDLYGDSLIKLALSDEVSGEIIDVATGRTLKSLVSNGGLLSADGGMVQLTAASTRAIVDSVINNTGNIEANSVGLRNGKIVLSAETAETKGVGAPAQRVSISGTLSATGGDAGETGGTIEITGEEIELLVATIDAFGWHGGGAVLIGGDVGGGNPDRTVVSETDVALADHALGSASIVTFGSGTVIDASAIDQGDGGKVIAWSDDATDFAGTILARGGRLGGDGGFVETSGHNTLAFTGTVDTSAPLGPDGTLLLDPLNVTIGTVGLHTITPAAIVAALATNNVKVTTGTTGAEDGDITVADEINWSNANSLTLSAARNIVVDAAITNTGGADVNLRADDTGTGVGTVTFDTGGSISTTGDVSLYYNPSVNPTGSGVNGASYVAPVETFAPYVTAGSFTPYMLVNSLYGLQNIQNNLSGTYALGRDVDASETKTWNGGNGFDPIGGTGMSANWRSTQFIGTLNGLGHTISDLTINSVGMVGLFSMIGSTGTVANLRLRNAVVGDNASGYVSPYWETGGVTGWNEGHISNVSVWGQVSGEGDVGGIVGFNLGYIDGSSFIGTTTGTWAVGGLVGYNDGIVRDSYSIGNVSSTGTYFAGGLVGVNEHCPSCLFLNPDLTEFGLIASSYSAATVAAGTGNAGGLVGLSAGASAVDAYWDTENSGTGVSAGGTGLPTADIRGNLLSGFGPSIWGIDPAFNNGYPYLLWERVAAAAETVLTPDSVTPPPPPPPPGPTLPSSFDQFATGQRNGFEVAALDIGIARSTFPLPVTDDRLLRETLAASQAVATLNDGQIKAAIEFWRYAIFANNAYGDGAPSMPLPEQWQPETRVGPQSSDTGFYAKSYVRYDADKNIVEIVIGYRGTDQLRDWWYGNASGSYMPNYQEKEAQDYARKVAAAYPGIPISTTGHSLGAALARYGAQAISPTTQAVGFDGSLLGKETDYYTNIFTEGEILNPVSTRASDVVFPDIGGSMFRITRHKDIYGLATLMRTVASMDFDVAAKD